MDHHTEAAGSVRVGVKPRLVTYGAVAIILLAGLTGRELWPLSGFFLFSYERTSRQQAWELVVVDASGAEQRAEFSQLPDNYSGYAQLMPKMLKMPEDEQQDAVAAWLDGLQLDDDAVAAKVYLVETEVPTEVGQTAVEVSRSQVLTVDLP